MLKRMVVAACASRLPYKPSDVDYCASIYRLERVLDREEGFWLRAVHSMADRLCWQDGGKI